MNTALIVVKVLVGIALILHVGACNNDISQKPEPPALPSQQELEKRLSRAAEGKWPLLSEAQFVYAVQKYCAYTDECKTEHLWLGWGWGYAFPSYHTVMRGQVITIPGICVVSASKTEACPAGQRSFFTYQRITGQGVYDAQSKMVPYFCVKKILK